MSVTVSAEANFNFPDIGEEVKRELSKEVVRAATNIERNAKQKVTENLAHGRLRASIGINFHPSTEPMQADVVVGADYGRFIEFGTGPRGRRSELNELARQAMRELGYVHGPGGWNPPIEPFLEWGRVKGLDPSVAMAIRATIGRFGMEAKPFLFPAFAAERNTFFQRAEEALRRAT